MGKVTVKKLFVNADILLGNDPFAWYDLDDFINEKKWVTMGQCLENFTNIHVGISLKIGSEQAISYSQGQTRQESTDATRELPDVTEAVA
jgi:hypothetical protein